MNKKFEYNDISLKILTDDQTEEYLNCKRHASVFSKVYENVEGFWDYCKPVFMEAIHDENIHMLIYNQPGEYIGYVESELDSDETCRINIGILPAYRKRNAAAIAAEKFLNYLFSEKNFSAVTWDTFKSNTASRKIAEKLGGKCISQKNNLKKAMKNAGFSGENEDLLNEFGEVSYLIEKQN